MNSQIESKFLENKLKINKNEKEYQKEISELKKCLQEKEKIIKVCDEEIGFLKTTIVKDLESQIVKLKLEKENLEEKLCQSQKRFCDLEGTNKELYSKISQQNQYFWNEIKGKDDVINERSAIITTLENENSELKKVKKDFHTQLAKG